METAKTYMPIGLLLISAVLLVWGGFGLVEYFFPAAAFGLQNASFPAGLQFLHFFSILLTGGIFILGYLARWPHTPFATIAMYAVLATLCFVETIDFGAFGGGTSGVIIMCMEFTLYIVLATYLLRASAIKDRFRPPFAV